MPSRRLRSRKNFTNAVADNRVRTKNLERYPKQTKISDGQIGEDRLGAYAVTASELDIAAVTSQKFSVGAYLPSGEVAQRVPAPLLDVAYWADVIEGDIEMHREGVHADEDILNVEATADGVVFTPTSVEDSRLFLTGRLPVPLSDSLYVSWKTYGAALPDGAVRVVWWATDELSSYHRYIFPQNETTTRVNSASFEASSIVVSAGTATLTVPALAIDARVTTVTGTGTAVTYTTDVAHGLSEGQKVASITGLSPSGYNLTDVFVDNVVSATKFTVLSAVTGAYTSGSGVVTPYHDLHAGETVTVTGTTATRTAGPLDGDWVLTGATDTTISWATDETTPSSPRALLSVVDPPEVPENLGRATPRPLEYTTYVEVPANAASYTLSSALVFETVGNITATGGAELAPNGLRLSGASATGGESINVSLTTDSDDVLRIQALNEAGTAFEDVASINSAGVGEFSAVSVDTDLTVAGEDLGVEYDTAGVETPAYSFYNAVRNGAFGDTGGEQYTGALLNRLGRGVVYLSTFADPTDADGINAMASGTLNYVIAAGKFTLNDRRMYEILLEPAGLEIDNTNNTRSMAINLLLSTVDPFVASTGYATPSYPNWKALSQTVLFSYSFCRGSEQNALIPLRTTVFGDAGVSVLYNSGSYGVPVDVPLYWIYAAESFNQANATNGTVNFEFVRTSKTVSSTTYWLQKPSIRVTDLGPVVTPTPGEQYANGAAGTGPFAVSGGGGTTITATKTLTATESYYYDNGGVGDAGTSDPYANERSLYHGNPGTSSGTKKSAIEFASLGLPAGATITNMQLYLKNRHTYDGSLQCYIGAHNTTELGSSLPVGVSSLSTTNSTFSSGQGKWVTLPSSWYSTWAAGNAKGILIGVTSTSASPDTYDSTLTNYGYFDGYLLSSPPKLSVTYTYTA